MLVQQILKAKGEARVITVTPDTPIREVAELLKAHRIGGVVISYTGKHADGILSERDLVRGLASRGAAILDLPAEALMTRTPQCGTPDMPVLEVLSRMTEGRFRHMPITEDGELVGIVTIGDAVKARLDQLAMEKDALEGMIMGY
ncbi:CBS domain-containing protein [Pseudooceanicola sp. CBS1P-1]|uniref:CBS domain-containing protein n=1 Tax=Pseudooceanicola albus TaxID=2692189 RepID=A0A6L7GAU6_9RHOB|nr:MULTISPECIES: CBS domain-containing protein [Pseudooceanicola]MBT9384441.1 CBS domain-containing protein [Pseudooceanicola endophyticus]MXN20658.1 CBS domain-containing protein [Pseudooceanicola albus]